MKRCDAFIVTFKGPPLMTQYVVVMFICISRTEDCDVHSNLEKKTSCTELSSIIRETDYLRIQEDIYMNHSHFSTPLEYFKCFSSCHISFQSFQFDSPYLTKRNRIPLPFSKKKKKKKEKKKQPILMTAVPRFDITNRCCFSPS